MAETEKRKEGSLFGPYVDAVSELDTFVELAWVGLGYATEATRIAEILRRRSFYNDQSDTFRNDEEQYGKKLESSKKLEQFGKKQVSSNFPFLYTLAIIRLWTILEALVNDIVLNLFSNFPDTLNAEVMRKLKGPLIEFAEANPNERAEYLVELLIQELRAKLKPGVGRFETLLEAVRLGGPITDSARRFLFELSQLRNAIVHRNGRADAKLTKNCPWLNIKVGDIIHISPKRFHWYVTAVHWYMLELSRRWILMDKNNSDKYADPKEIVDLMKDLQTVLDNAELSGQKEC